MYLPATSFNEVIEICLIFICVDNIQYPLELCQLAHQEIMDVIKDPSNGLTIQSDAFTSFDKFRWSLKETEVSFVVEG